MAGAPSAHTAHHPTSHAVTVYRGRHKQHAKVAHPSSPAKSGTAKSGSTSPASSTGTSASSSSGTAKTIDGYKVLKTIKLTATAYGPSAQDNYPYGAVDYYGAPLKAGDVAVDPSVIPLGTKLWVTGYSSANLPSGGFLATADDEGGAIKGDRLDIYINEPDSIVNNFGIQPVTVYVLGN